MAQRATGKISVRNLQYGPRTRLVRGIYGIKETAWCCLGTNELILFFRPTDNTAVQDNTEAAFQVVGYRKPGGKVIHEHWV